MLAQRTAIIQKNNVWKRWFADDAHENVKRVNYNMMDEQGNAKPQIAEMVCDWNDFGKVCDNGQGVKAYTSEGTGRFHICPLGWVTNEKEPYKNFPDLDQVTCDKLDREVSFKMNSLAYILVHEFM